MNRYGSPRSRPAIRGKENRSHRASSTIRSPRGPKTSSNPFTQEDFPVPRSPQSRTWLAAAPETNCSVLRTSSPFAASIPTSIERSTRCGCETGTIRPPSPAASQRNARWSRKTVGSNGAASRFPTRASTRSRIRSRRLSAPSGHPSGLIGFAPRLPWTFPSTACNAYFTPGGRKPGTAGRSRAAAPFPTKRRHGASRSAGKRRALSKKTPNAFAVPRRTAT